MRVGIDLREVDAPSPGQQRYLRRLGAWLAAEGHAVHLLTTRRQPEGSTPPPGTELHRLVGLTPRELEGRLRRLGLDVLLLNPERATAYRGIRANVLRAGYGTDQGRQNLRSVQAPLQRVARAALRASPWLGARRRWERAFYEADPAPEVIAQSAYMEREILDSYRIDADRVHVVPNGVDLGELSPAAREAGRAPARAHWSIPAEAVCLLFLAHNFRLKGLWQTLPAFARLVRAGAPVHLLVAGQGRGGQRARAARLTGRLGLGGRVTIAGSVVPPLPALAAADVLVHPSWHDSFGFVVLEAMASGLPVVTSPYAGASELLEDGVSGRVVDPADEGALAAALGGLLEEGRRRRMGEAAATAASARSEEASFMGVASVLRAARARAAGPVV